MNDSSEGRWLDYLVERLIHAAQEWNEWRESGHIYHDYKLFKKTFFIACFSEHGDLLSQWRAYADDGRGVSAGFSFDDLAVPTGLTFTNVFHRRPLGCTIDRVVYEEKEQSESLRRVFRYIDHLVRSDFARHPYMYDALIGTGRDCLSYLSRLLKHPGFSEEREWRILYDGESDHKTIGLDGTALKNRLRGDTEIGYFELNFRSASQPIRDVLLGPKCTMSLGDAEQLLRNADYQGAKVRKSSIPYR
jgi:hypothetical protein